MKIATIITRKYVGITTFTGRLLLMPNSSAKSRPLPTGSFSRETPILRTYSCSSAAKAHASAPWI